MKNITVTSETSYEEEIITVKNKDAVNTIQCLININHIQQTFSVDHPEDRPLEIEGSLTEETVNMYETLFVNIIEFLREKL